MLARVRAYPRGRALLLILAVVVVMAVSFVSLAAFTQPTPSPTPSPSSPSPTPSPSPTATPVPTPTPTPVPTPNPFLGRRLTVLILGSDSNPERLSRGSGRLTDSIIVLSVNAAHTQVSMISVPRDMVDIPTGTGGVWSGKINSLSYYRGEPAMKKAISTMIRQPINYYVEINMPDFGLLVNSIGGIDVKVPKTIVDPSIGLSVRAGLRHMSGNLALSYARSRHTTSDWDRAARQQLIMAAIVRKLVDPKTKVDFPRLIASFTSIRTDLPLGQFLGLVQVARAAASARIVGTVLAPPRFTTFTGIVAVRGYIEEPNLAAIRAYAASVMGGT